MPLLTRAGMLTGKPSVQRNWLVVTEYHVPEMNGTELISKLRRLLPEVPVVVKFQRK
jgi:CheY-like chemotaxis protein